METRSFGDYRTEGHLWITLSSGDYYPDILPLALELYKPVDLLPVMPPFMGRVCSGYAPGWGVLQTLSA